MVRHAVAKKRRRGVKVTRKPPKHRVVKVANSVVNPNVKSLYDKSKTPSQNLQAFGLNPDANAVQTDTPLDGNYAGFVGYGNAVDGVCYSEANPKRRKISDFDMRYAAKNISKHGEDYKSMELDIKTNDRQLTAKQMEKLCRVYKEEKASHMHVDA